MVLYDVLIDELTTIFRSPKVGRPQILTMEYVTHLEAPSSIFDYHPTHHPSSLCLMDLHT